MRGEHLKILIELVAVPGSSPHARGALFFPQRHAPDFGIIPACAGSTLHPIQLRSDHQDHPRMRGEHLLRNSVE